MKLVNSYCFLLLSIYTVLFFSSVNITINHSINSSHHSKEKNQKLPSLINKYLGMYKEDNKHHKLNRKNTLTNDIHTNNKKNDRINVQKKNKLIQYKTKIISNPLLINVEIPSHYKKCSVRSGSLFLLLKKPLPPMYEIEVTPIYIMLTTDRLILTKDMNKINLIESFAIKEIQRIDQHYENTSCFDIIGTQVLKKKMKNVQLTLCGKNYKQMNSWINSVLEFKKCSLKEIQKANHKKTVFVDFNRINKLTPVKTSKKNSSIPSKKVFKNKLQRKIVKSINKSNKYLEIGKIAKRNLRENVKGRYNKRKLFKKKNNHRKFIRKNHLSNKKIHRVHNNRRIVQRINIVKKEVKKLKELKQLKKIYEDEIKKENKKLNEESKKMMYLLKSKKNSTEQLVCYDKKLKGFKNKVLIDDMCNQYYGKFAGDTCKNKENFCIMCCDFHIGALLKEKRLRCKEKCNRVISK